VFKWKPLKNIRVSNGNTEMAYCKGPFLVEVQNKNGPSNIIAIRYYKHVPSISSILFSIPRANKRGQTS
jgi:hypothetical protein